MDGGNPAHPPYIEHPGNQLNRPMDPNLNYPVNGRVTVTATLRQWRRPMPENFHNPHRQQTNNENGGTNGRGIPPQGGNMPATNNHPSRSNTTQPTQSFYPTNYGNLRNVVHDQHHYRVNQTGTCVNNTRSYHGPVVTTHVQVATTTYSDVYYQLHQPHNYTVTPSAMGGMQQTEAYNYMYGSGVTNQPQYYSGTVQPYPIGHQQIPSYPYVAVTTANQTQTYVSQQHHNQSDNQNPYQNHHQNNNNLHDPNNTPYPRPNDYYVYSNVPSNYVTPEYSQYHNNNYYGTNVLTQSQINDDMSVTSTSKRTGLNRSSSTPSIPQQKLIQQNDQRHHLNNSNYPLGVSSDTRIYNHLMNQHVASPTNPIYPYYSEINNNTDTRYRKQIRSGQPSSYVRTPAIQTEREIPVNELFTDNSTLIDMNLRPASMIYPGNHYTPVVHIRTVQNYATQQNNVSRVNADSTSEERAPTLKEYLESWGDFEQEDYNNDMRRDAASTDPHRIEETCSSGGSGGGGVISSEDEDQMAETQKRQKNPEEEPLYILDSSDITEDLLPQYSHVQQVTRLPSNIKGYLNQTVEKRDESNHHLQDINIKQPSHNENDASDYNSVDEGQEESGEEEGADNNHKESGYSGDGEDSENGDENKDTTSDIKIQDQSEQKIDTTNYGDWKENNHLLLDENTTEHTEKQDEDNSEQDESDKQETCESEEIECSDEYENDIQEDKPENTKNYQYENNKKFENTDKINEKIIKQEQIHKVIVETEENLKDGEQNEEEQASEEQLQKTKQVKWCDMPPTPCPRRTVENQWDIDDEILKNSKNNVQIDEKEHGINEFIWDERSLQSQESEQCSFHDGPILVDADDEKRIRFKDQIDTPENEQSTSSSQMKSPFMDVEEFVAEKEKSSSLPKTQYEVVDTLANKELLINPENPRRPLEINLDEIINNITKALANSKSNVSRVQASPACSETSDDVSESVIETTDKILNRANEIVKQTKDMVDTLPKPAQSNVADNKRIPKFNILSITDYTKNYINTQGISTIVQDSSSLDSENELTTRVPFKIDEDSTSTQIQDTSFQEKQNPKPEKEIASMLRVQITGCKEEENTFSDGLKPKSRINLEDYRKRQQLKHNISVSDKCSSSKENNIVACTPKPEKRKMQIDDTAATINDTGLSKIKKKKKHHDDNNEVSKMINIEPTTSTSNNQQKTDLIGVPLKCQINLQRLNPTKQYKISKARDDDMFKLKLTKDNDTSSSNEVRVPKAMLVRHGAKYIVYTDPQWQPVVLTERVDQLVKSLRNSHIFSNH